MMLEDILTVLYGAVVLFFGVTLTGAFAGIRGIRKNSLILLGLCLFCGGLQLAAHFAFSPETVWKLYPLITHLPLIVLLCFYYRKTLVTALASAFTAYLLCQPAKWVGVLTHQLTGSRIAESCGRILCLFLVAGIALYYLTSCLSDIYNKDRRSVVIFAIVPTVYYVFDYVTAVYTDLWISNNRVVAEFLPFFLAATYILFCTVYYSEYEQKADALRNEQIMRITAQQQAKEIIAVKRSEQEIRLLRHDMRLLLSSLNVCIDNEDPQKARELIAAYTDSINRTRVERFCDNDAVNYVLSDYAGKCKALDIPFTCIIEMEELKVDEILFCSILSNALDNALNAQKPLPAGKRSIRVMIKISNGKLLLSVKNPVGGKVVFSDGLPVAGKRGHGYGTQSIRYMTEKLGGNCQFSVQDDLFILRVVL